MKTYIDNNYYLKKYKGEVPEPELEKLIIEASSYIKKQTSDRVSIKNIPEEVQTATCLIIDKIYSAEQDKKEMGNLKSQNIEGWQETYKTDEEINATLEKEKYQILNTYLSDVIGVDGNLLLYCGVQLMNKRFFKDKITVYHIEGEKATRMPFNEVYFRHNKKTNLIDKRT